MSSSFRKTVITNFKLQGLQLRNEATSYLVEVLEPLSHRQDISDVFDLIIDAVQKQPLKSSLIGRDVMEIAVEEVNQASDADPEKALVPIDAFKIPSYSYNPSQKKFLSDPARCQRVHATAGLKAALLRERHSLIHQRMLHNKFFSPPVLGGSSLPGAAASTSKYTLHSVDYLLSSSGLPDKVIVLGMLSILREGKLHLEDPTGTVELDVSQCEFQTGLFVESSIVLAEGIYDDEIFHVGAIGFPPLESSTETRGFFGNVNFFGGPSVVCAKSSVKLQAMLKENTSAMLVFLSDVYLDDAKVMEKLNRLFSGYSDSPPVAFVFMGNFSSTPYGPAQYQSLRESFKALGDMLLQYEELAKQSLFYFVPGPLDPSPGNVLPRPPIHSAITSVLTDRIPNVQFCSNPCRIQFCTKEIVVFRENILNKMTRHCVRFPNDDVEMPTHFVKTILSQGHLCPLPIHSRPVYWMLDHALWLYPLPDLVVIGDKCDPYSTTSADCQVVNPGSFPKSGFEFKVYMPSSGNLDDCKIMD